MNKVLVLLGVVFLCCGCDKRNKDSHMRGAVMRMCTSTDPATIDPRRNGDFWSSNLLFFVYEGLTRILPNGEAELALAETVEIAEDGCTYLFKLRDAVWTDGAPLTAYDFEHTWKTSIDPKFAAACPYLLYPVKNAEKIAAGELPPSALGVKAIDAHTLEVELEHPTPYFLSLITFCNFFAAPKHIESIDPKWEHKRPEELVFSGPFKVKRWIRK